MTVTKNDVQKIAHLARMDIPEGQLDKYTSELNQILGHVDDLNRLDTRDVPPMAGVVSKTTTLREDATVDPAPAFLEEVLAKAPQTDRVEGDFFTVPQVIE